MKKHRLEDFGTNPVKPQRVVKVVHHLREKAEPMTKEIHDEYRRRQMKKKILRVIK